MINFEEMLLLDEKILKNKLAEIDSSDLIIYLKNCNNNGVKNKYYKIIKKILGKNYLKLLKMAVNYNGK
jgi:flagellar motor switch protein FliG